MMMIEARSTEAIAIESAAWTRKQIVCSAAGVCLFFLASAGVLLGFSSNEKNDAIGVYASGGNSQSTSSNPSKKTVRRSLLFQDHPPPTSEPIESSYFGNFKWTAPSTPIPTKSPTPPPTKIWTKNPTMRPTGPCTSSFTIATYDSIDKDIATLKDSISNEGARGHFLGGIVRLAAHDFMDFDPSGRIPMGPDGCFDADHPNNAGLETIWCNGCGLTELHRRKYSHISRADFWIASANAVIRLTSVGNLDLRDTFLWGRSDRATCGGSGDRLPRPAGCGEVERVFLTRMGLEWRDAVALMGAHTLGRGDRDFSGHHGTWADNDQDAQVFDKQYFTDLTDEAWRTRNRGGPADGGPPQDWTTGRGTNNRMMLNTDICLTSDIDRMLAGGDSPCCTRTDRAYPDGQNQCVDRDSSRRRCPGYSQNNPRRAASDAVEEYRGGDGSTRFYDAFAEAWRKATIVGQGNLSPLTETCESI